MKNYRESPPWPTPTDTDSAEQTVELFKAQVAEAALRRSMYDTADHESRVAVEAAQLAVLTGSLERARDSAKTIQTSATAIATLYTGLVGAVFSVADNKPLPLRGVIPVVYLGGAIVFATVFLGWFRQSSSVGPFPSADDPVGIRVERVKWFGNWVTLSVLTKAWSLRLATLLLAGGLMFLPVAFVPVHASGAASLAISQHWILALAIGYFVASCAVVLFQARVGDLHRAIEHAKRESSPSDAGEDTSAPAFRAP